MVNFVKNSNNIIILKLQNIKNLMKKFSKQKNIAWKKDFYI